MKKIIVLVAFSMFMASSAFAAASLTLALDGTHTGLSLYGAKSGATVSGGVPAAGTVLIGKTSTNVGLGLAVDATAGSGYSLETQHKSGTKAFGTSYDSTSIFQKDVTAGTADGTSLTTGSSSFASGWTTQ